MAKGKGFWRSVAGAFVEFDEAAPRAGRTDLDATLKSTEALLAEIGGGKGATKPSAQPGSPGAAPAGPPPKAAAPPPAREGSSAAPIEEGGDLAALYAQRGLPTVAHTAEQMLAILDGLAALPPDAARVAIKAMDDADDRWTVTDVLNDARAKTDALVHHVNDLAARAQAAAEAAHQERGQVDTMLAEAEAEIQRQIAALQGELDQFRADAAARRAEIDAAASATRDAAARESGRVQAEIARLGRIASFLGPLTRANAPTDPTRS